MMLFWVGAIALALLTLAFFLWPLLANTSKHSTIELSAEDRESRLQANVGLFREHVAELDAALAEGRIDQPQYTQLKLEQERTLLADDASLNETSADLKFKVGRVGLMLVAAGLIAASFGLYNIYGSSADVAIQQLQQEKARLDFEDFTNDREPNVERARALMAKFEARLEDEPENLQYWFILARHAMEIGDYTKAASAYKRTLALDPQAPMVMGEYAQALFLRDNNQMTPEVAQLAQTTLQLDPENTTALGLAGIESFQKRDFKSAIKYWQKVLDLSGLDAPGTQALKGGIARAKEELAKSGESVVDGESKEPAVASGRSIQVKVSIAAGVKTSPDQLVYIYARAWQGSRMPLAITRVTVAELPKTIILNETMAMSTMASLAQADQVEVVARISTDGTATAKPGDLQVSAGPLDMKNLPKETELIIAEKLTE